MPNRCTPPSPTRRISRAKARPLLRREKKTSFRSQSSTDSRLLEPLLVLYSLLLWFLSPPPPSSLVSLLNSLSLFFPPAALSSSVCGCDWPVALNHSFHDDALLYWSRNQPSRPTTNERTIKGDSLSGSRGHGREPTAGRETGLVLLFHQPRARRGNTRGTRCQSMWWW